MACRTSATCSTGWGLMMARGPKPPASAFASYVACERPRKMSEKGRERLISSHLSISSQLLCISYSSSTHFYSFSIHYLSISTSIISYSTSIHFLPISTQILSISKLQRLPNRSPRAPSASPAPCRALAPAGSRDPSPAPGDPHGAPPPPSASSPAAHH